MKKGIAIALSAVMLLTMAAGCSKSDSEALGTSTSTTEVVKKEEVKKDPVKLVLWAALPEENGPKEVCDNFNKLDPLVQVEYYRYVNDDAGNMKLDMALAAGENIDMFVSYTPERRDKRIETNNCADITDLCKENDIDLIRDFGSGAQANIYNGKVYSIPTMKYMDLIIYNKSMFDAAGIAAPTTDTTWDDWREIAKKLTKGEGDKKVYGFQAPINGGIYGMYAMTKYPSTNYWMNDTATASLFKSIPEYAQGVQFFKDMQDIDKSVMSYKEVITSKMDTNNVILTAFTNEKLASVISGTHMLRTIKDTKQYPHTFVTAFAPMPIVDKNQDKYYAPVSTNDHIAVNANCTAKEEAVKFIKWYYSKGYDPMIKNGRLPLYTKYDADAALKLITEGAETLIDSATLKSVLFGNYTDFKVQGSTKAGTEIRTVGKEETEAYFLGQIDLDKYIDNLQKRVDEALKNAK